MGEYVLTEEGFLRYGVKSRELYRECRLHAAELECLILLASQPEGSKMKNNDLVRITRLNPGQITRIKKKLRSRGHAIERISREDRRCIDVIITPEGRELYSSFLKKLSS